jgi:uncharacterized protein involved in exopolysaccharide biosynthesis
LDDAMDEMEIEESGAKPRRPGLPVEPRRLLWILSEHRALLLRAFLAATLVALVASFFVPKRYESSAQLLYEGIPLLDPGEKKRSPDAFVQAATAPSRLREVRDRLGWNVRLKDLGDQVQVRLDPGASMRIVGEAKSAEDALALTHAVVDVFLSAQQSFNKKRLERLRAENESALEHANQRRERALQGYEAFRKKSGKSNVLEEQKDLLARSTNLRAQVEEASVEAAAQKARIEELEQSRRDLPRQIVSSAKVGSPVDSPLAKARAELAEARASLSEQHPKVQALKQRVASLQAQRGSQRSEVGEQTLVANPARSSVDQQIASAKAALAAAQERESALRVLLASVKKEAEALAPEEGEARQVLRELEVADERLEELHQEAAAIRDASVGPLTGFRVLSVPMLPEESKRSKAYVLGLLALPVVTVLILALAILGRRLRTLTVEAPREVAWWGNGPVLGTSVWPRDPGALGSFVDELEDQGMYGAGRTLVVPATETEREIACSFAMRLAEAPWLAAAILDVDGSRGGDDPFGPLVTPAPHGVSPSSPPPPSERPRRLSAQGTPSVVRGRVVTTPPSRPPRSQTVIGLPAVKSESPVSDSPPDATTTTEGPSAPPRHSAGPEPFKRKRNARATIRMVVPANEGSSLAAESIPGPTATEAEAFLLTRPVPVASDPSSPRSEPEHPNPSPQAESRQATTSTAVMRAAMRLLGDEGDDLTEVRRSQPPTKWSYGQVRGVALAWNGPLSGPVIRRAARLAHRVMVVVSSGMSGLDLARVRTRLGREDGVGYVLVNVSDAYVDLEDRVGPVEAFWQASLQEGQPPHSGFR